MRVLLVEDDVALTEVLRRGLSEDAYAVDTAGSCAEATQQMDLNEYDLYLLDLGLPDGSGIDLCIERRRLGDQTPILMLTARDSLSEKVDGLDAGADDYLPKPFHFPELAARMRALLRRPTNSHSPILTVGHLRLDPAKYEVWVHQVIIPLTSREFALLRYLMLDPHRVVSRTELLEHLWDENYDGLSNVVDVHIANLRRKLATPSHPEVVETVRGVGYRIANKEPAPS